MKKQGGILISDQALRFRLLPNHRGALLQEQHRRNSAVPGPGGAGPSACLQSEPGPLERRGLHLRGKVWTVSVPEPARHLGSGLLLLVSSNTSTRKELGLTGQRL